ncbi:hypothetical protein [Cohaesibacter celericrescens]|uniref:TIGR03750 family conjugal transfer protein n=1 Tax=Cohaesibacter celericrescens TaxID=2067669 RepID=A0A2N5XRN2_9HYPH|nr:hypothetical protein [Cohaesibacter celericrescens]PLW77181.1 hypothetical protein C0081_10940 [Cohaesibacter celericrescens]
MKAQSSVATYVQEPMKILGMSPMHFAMVIIAEVLSALLAGVLGGSSVAFVLFFVTLPFGIGWAVYARRKDSHCETLFLLPNSFFKGKASRHLVAGEKVEVLR